MGRICWIRPQAIIPAILAGGLLCFVSETWSQDPRSELIRPSRRFAEPPLDQQPNELDLDGHNGFDVIGSSEFQPAAWQTQYPLPGDSGDLKPGLDRVDEQAMSDSPASAEDVFEDSSEQAWVVWQKTTGLATWLAPGSGGLGITSLDLRGSVEFPNFQALWFVPRVGWHLLDGPTVSDLPAQLYDFSWEAVAAMPVGNRWTFQAALAPSFFSDLNNTSSKAFRLPGRLLAFWKWTDTLTLSGGVFYLDRDDVKWLPVGGFIWNPSDDWKLEIMAPRPRIAWRVSHDESQQSWAYVVGEFGGGTWAVQRANGVDDVATLRDYRLLLGYEQKRSAKQSWWIEAGYVFKRRVEYTSAIGDSDLSSTALARLGLTF